MFRMIPPYIALGLIGFFVGVVGTGGHRLWSHWGVACSLALVLAAGVFARAWRSWTGQAVFAATWLAVVLVLYFMTGPGGSTLVVDDTLGRVWLIGGGFAAIVPVVIPRRFLEEGSTHG